MYKVIHYFTDLQDDGYAYDVGDEFPHKGMTVTNERIAELSGLENKQGVPLAGRFFDFCCISEFLSLLSDEIPKNFHKNSAFPQKILNLNGTIYIYI